MNEIIINIKKVANHWYVALNHDDPYSVILPERTERIVYLLDKYKTGKVSLYLMEQQSIIHENTILFRDEDIDTYFANGEDMDNFLITIGNIQFEIYPEMYTLLEEQYHLEFYKTLYSCQVF